LFVARLRKAPSLLPHQYASVRGRSWWMAHSHMLRAGRLRRRANIGENTSTHGPPGSCGRLHMQLVSYQPCAIRTRLQVAEIAFAAGCPHRARCVCRLGPLGCVDLLTRCELRIDKVALTYALTHQRPRQQSRGIRPRPSPQCLYRHFWRKQYVAARTMPVSGKRREER
jgi:hypothetical protein